MTTFVLEHLKAFPEWYRVLLLSAWGSLLILVPIYSIVKILQSPPMLSLFRATPDALKRVGAFLQYQIDDPIKFPKIQRAVEYVMVVQSYLMSGLLFVCFLVIVIGWGMAAEKLSLLEHIGIIGFSFICAYWAAVLKTQGSRELLKIRGSQSA
ncbi:hypothetical protein FGKAn22_11000 [Ferrigenium kumadai]|uniref:Uncharacterized protein n=1 Tax=Ferrigenium kumadai TaxID=1682490 RepID=A0AAN1W0K7_9PROT|nr:hypothetical protein [Ferrigenium kumadai]BBI99407.1 hypothetical protein FGKAn22_11000 [Ferrigenium kumadai]